MKKHFLFLPALLSGVALVTLPSVCNATNPAGGTLSASTTTALTFVGTAPGTAADSEPDGIEGVNKDTCPDRFTWRLYRQTHLGHLELDQSGQ